MARPPKIDNRKARTFEQVCDHIRAQLAAGVLKDGDKLPPEREMAEHFRIGRNAVREALRTLENAGVVRLEKGRKGGAYICPVNSIRVTIAMRDLLNVGSIGLGEIAEARALLMDLVTRLICERATSADFDALDRVVDEVDEATKAGDFNLRTRGILQFYACLGGMAHNRVLMTMTTSLSEIVRRLLDGAALRGRPLDSTVPSYRRYVRQLRNRDVQNACAEIREHLINTHNVIQQEVERVAGIARGTTVTLAQHPRVRARRRRARTAA